jgi:hypothetical protein
MLTRLTPVLVALAATLVSPVMARADDGYICDGGRLVYALPETREKFQHADPCAGFLSAANKPAPVSAPVSRPAGPTARQLGQVPRGTIHPLVNEKRPMKSATGPRTPSGSPRVVPPLAAGQIPSDRDGAPASFRELR